MKLKFKNVVSVTMEIKEKKVKKLIKKAGKAGFEVVRDPVESDYSSGKVLLVLTRSSTLPPSAYVNVPGGLTINPGMEDEGVEGRNEPTGE